LSERIIGRAFHLQNTLATGFREKAYQKALAHELRQAGLPVAQQQVITVMYDGIAVGTYSRRPVGECTIIVEVNTIGALDSTHHAMR